MMQKKMDKKGIKIFVLLAIILLLSVNALAQLGALMLRGIAGAAIAEGFKLLAKTWIASSGWEALSFLEAIFDNLPLLLTTNPPMSEITSGMFFFIKIIAPFYILAIVILALYILMASSSVRGRAKAKSMLTNLIIGLVLISLSPGVLGILFIVSENLAKALISMGANAGISALKGASGGLYEKFWKLTLIHRTGGVELFAIHTTLLFGLTTLLLLRHVMVILFGMLLPLAFFLYLFYPTKHIGKGLFVQVFLWTFMPIAWILALVIIGTVIGSIPTYIPEFYILIAALFFFIGSPMMILGVGDWLAFLVFLFEVLQAAPLSIGAVVIDETMK